MRRSILLSLLALTAVAATLVTASPALAHGYVSAPASRQAQCAQGRVTGCGQIQYEPQSVEGPKGLRSCSGGNAQFAVLDDDGKGWAVTPVGTSVTFTWVFTARHATSNWEYFIGNTRIAVVDGGGRQPGASVAHQVNLAGWSGRQKILAVWNIADTTNAFYSCVDVQIGGGGGTTPTPTPTTSPTGRPTPSPSPTTTAPTPPTTGGSWSVGTSYQVGDRVSYDGVTYQCRQAHTAIAGWEPPAVPALWTRL